MRAAILSLLLMIAAAARAQLNIDSDTAITRNPKFYSLIVNKDGRTICQRYFNGHDGSELMKDQSLTKSIVSLLIGIAIEKTYIRSVDQPIIDFFPELTNDPDLRKKQVTIREIMNQASGLYHEDNTRLGAYLALPSQKDIVLQSPLVSNPGEIWQYSNAATHLLSVILTKATGTDTYSFGKKYLFDPLGITKLDWVKMKDGYYDGSGLLSIRMRSEDMLKIGLLILHRGRYNDRQIVPEKWIDMILNPDKFYHTDWGFDRSTYALCYYHAQIDSVSLTYGMGWGGQFLVIIPSLNAVVVANQSIEDATAIRQETIFTSDIFPFLLRQLNIR